MKKTIVLKVDPGRPDPKSISEAAEILKGGGLVAFPTETVYGLGANALDDKAVEELYRVKERPKDKPFTVQVLGLDAVKRMCGLDLTRETVSLAGKFWPGPLTMILKSKDGGKIGFRMPSNKIALALLMKVKTPLYVPSANVSGNKPPTTAKDVLKELNGEIELVIDGGPSEVGVESTVVDMSSSPAKILREGAISREALSEIINL